jgi:hypothetical protein
MRLAQGARSASQVARGRYLFPRIPTGANWRLDVRTATSASVLEEEQANTDKTAIRAKLLRPDVPCCHASSSHPVNRCRERVLLVVYARGRRLVWLSTSTGCGNRRDLPANQRWALDPDRKRPFVFGVAAFALQRLWQQYAAWGALAEERLPPGPRAHRADRARARAHMRRPLLPCTIE